LTQTPAYHKPQQAQDHHLPLVPRASQRGRPVLHLIFPNSKITYVQRYLEAGREHHGHEPGTVLVVEFVLDGHHFVGLNGGPHFKFNEAVSFQIDYANQEEVDYY
jgi:predicted 3-demethylubiquinone-9 3-methyltransferase (glyoxalase superfamily)